MSARSARRLTASVAILLSCAGALALAGPAAAARRPFRPRIRFAMGLMPIRGQQEIAASPSTPVVYHGGQVMRDVRVHTIFWAPSGFAFTGPPSPGTRGYEDLVKQFLTDVAHDSGSGTNEFSILPQYHDGAGPGSEQIAYDPASDSIDAHDPFPAQSDQCSSPAGVRTCVTDLQLQQEIDRVIARGPAGGRGLANVWFVFLPPDVDECITVGACGTSAFAGYHSLSNLGHGPTIYVAVPDPLIELTPPPGQDPQGNPEAEATLDTIAHEAVEAMTDPEGTAWMDPNGFEVADKCENPEFGPPLGFAPDGSPFNQVINGHEYLLQGMWSNAEMGCVLHSSATGSALPLSSVSLSQYSPRVSGRLSTGRAGVGVDVALSRAGAIVATAHTRTRAGGRWGPVALTRGSRRAAVGDDRDELLVLYDSPDQPPEIVETGNGGNPFTQSGYTGWFALDNGYAVHRRQVLLGPCSQTGVLALKIGSSFTEPPAELCETESDAAIVATRPLAPRTRLSMSSEDNRADNPLNPDGALIKLTVPLGEPDSVSALGNGQVLFEPTGFPSCIAFLRTQTVSCSGLVPGKPYRLRRARGRVARGARAGGAGVAVFSGFPGRDRRGIFAGDALTLSNAAGRRLTTLHVAHLRVNLDEFSRVVQSGICQPGDYYGPPLRRPPVAPVVALSGVGGSGTICPLSGRARGLSTSDIAQTDDQSGGQTVVRVPAIEAVGPSPDANEFGAFFASAESAVPGPAGAVEHTHDPISLTVRAVGSHRVAFRAANVNNARGVAVKGLAPGTYAATWVLRDAGGDTRTLHTRFAEAP